SNLDLIKPNKIVNLPFIKEDPNIVGDKAIYNIFLANDDLAYLACGFGVVELNIDREEFGFTTKMNLKVNDIHIYEGSFYAATNEGIYRASNDGSLNLQDFGNWKLLGTEEGFPSDYSSRSVETYNGKLYIDIDDTLYYYENSTLVEIYTEEGFEITFLSADGAHLLVGMGCIESCEGKVLFFDENHNTQRSGSKCVSRTHYAIEDSNGGVWYGDRWDAIRISETATGDCRKETFNSPYTHDAIELVIDDNDLYVTTETPPSNNSNGFYQFKDGNWNIFNSLFNSALSGIRSVYRVAVHPENKKIYAGTFYQGLWEIDGENYTLYDSSNSPLGESAEAGRVRIGGLAFDKDNNLWMANHTSASPLVVLKNDGTWQNNFNLPYNALQDIVIDEAGNKWSKIDGSGQGIAVFNEGDMTVQSDDQVWTFTTSNSALPTNIVNCIAVDLDGDVWVGTDEGVVVFECGSNVFDTQCKGSRRIVEVDGFNAYLLETESVRTIAIDGANRKWFGTTNGVFVQSANGEDQIAFFDKDNSPLFNNTINDIAINRNSGEVFIGTASGLISIRGEATGGGSRHESTVFAYPNPVRPDYNGPIAIKGLPRDANVKITDVSGQLVYETKALGGQAIWDGRDYNGRKAASGVYLVFSTSKEVLDNPDAEVTKILFMK
ncbi:MAG: ligand-binding sensor domain-containing protein, partial [Saprospiraceae bacterium]